MKTKIYGGALRSAAEGFSRTDLIAVVTVVGLLGLLAFFGIGHLKGNALRSQCRANQLRIAGALSMYAEDHNALLPDCTIRNRAFYGADWPWDMSTNLTEELERNGCDRRYFYCPANPAMNDDDHWDFWRLVPANRTRIIAYPTFLPGVRELPKEFWCADLHGNQGKSPAQTELLMDATISVGGDFTNVKGILTDRSNHLKGATPLGGNIDFEDGHVEWRDFKVMQHRFSTGANVLWDF